MGLAWLRDIVCDVRFAGRLLRRNPGFTLGAAIPLAFAIGCAACAFTLADAILFRHTGVREPERVAAVYAYSRQTSTFVSNSYPEFRDVASLGNIVASAAAFVRLPVNVRFGEVTERMNSELIAGDYFRTAGIAPALGRALGARDQDAGASPVAMISYRIWEDRFQKSSTVLGSPVWIDGAAFTIVGVMPRGYSGSLLDWYAGPSFWIPLAQLRQMLPEFERVDYEHQRDMRWLMVIARLGSRTRLAQLQAAVATIAGDRGAQGVTFVAMPANEARFFPGHRPRTVQVLRLLTGIALVALAIACLNMVTLVLARAAARRSEFAARLALGAGTGRLIRQATVESMVLAACACVLGLPMAAALATAANAFQSAFGLLLDLGLNLRALAASSAIGMAASVLAGVLPAWRSAQTAPARAIRGAGPDTSRHPWRLASADTLLIAQIACAMTALTAAALAGQSLHHWQTVPLGYSPRGILVGTVDALSAGMPAGAREKAYRGMLAEVRSATHGAALAADVLPTSVRAPLEVAAGWELGAWRRIDANAVSDGYFDLLQMQLVAGRGIAPTDDSQRRPVVVVNESAAKLFWPGRNPVGLRMRIRGEPEPREVAGVVADARYRPLGEAEPVLPYLFLPLFQRPPAVVVIHARTPAAPKGFLPVLRRIVAQTTGGAPLTDVGPLESKVQSALSQVRLVSRATGVVGLLGITLAAAGVFASGCYRVAQRRREIAIRIALGAVPGRIIGLFTTRGMLAGFAGSIAGLIPAAWSSQLLRASLRGIGTADAVLFAGLAIFLTAIATAASWIGARRIASIQPAEALAAE